MLDRLSEAGLNVDFIVNGSIYSHELRDDVSHHIPDANKIKLVENSVAAGIISLSENHYRTVDISDIVCSNCKNPVAVQVSGDSMIPDLDPGDYVIYDVDSLPKRGELVVCLHNSVMVIKIYHKRNDIVELSSINQSYPILYLSDKDKIFGVVRSIIKKPKRYK